MYIYEAGHLDYLRQYTFSAPSHFMLFRMKDDITSAAPHISAHMKQKIGSNIFFHKEHVARKFYIITSLHFTYHLHIRFFYISYIAYSIHFSFQLYFWWPLLRLTHIVLIFICIRLISILLIIFYLFTARCTTFYCTFYLWHITSHSMFLFHHHIQRNLT